MMDSFESMSDESKMAILEIIGKDIQLLSFPRLPGDMKEAAKKGQMAMKQLQLGERAQKNRKAGVTKLLQTADPDATPDVLIVVKSHDIYSLDIAMMTPNTCAKIIVFCTLDTNLPSNLPPESLFESVELIRNFPGICFAAEIPVDENKDEQEMTITNLKPSRHYKIYAFILCTTPMDRTFREMTIDECDESAEIALTLPEIVDMKWHSLSEEMQHQEVRAATRCSFVLSASQALDRPLIIPQEKDFEGINSATTSGRACIKRIQMFTNWWAPLDHGLSAIRKQFLF